MIVNHEYPDVSATPPNTKNHINAYYMSCGKFLAAIKKINKMIKIA
jgi:hypothetical protein